MRVANGRKVRCASFFEAELFCGAVFMSGL